MTINSILKGVFNPKKGRKFRSLNLSILSSTRSQFDDTFWVVVSAAVEQLRRKANMVRLGEGEFCPGG